MQTLYLLISLIAWVFLFFTPVIAFSNGAGGVWGLFAGGIKEAVTLKVQMETIPLLAYLALTGLLTLIPVFLYRKTGLQLRITRVAFILQLLSYGIILLYSVQGNKLLGTNTVVLAATAIPLFSALFTWMALRAIKKDISLLKSLDRLR
jgi:hypothetical protein